MAAGHGPERQGGSILLPVILLLLLLATAATAMTLRARTSLREAATRRDRLVLAATADAAVRAAALSLAAAASARTSPPFGLDGTAQACRLADGRHLALAVQDEGGLVDLNKANAELVADMLRRAGLSAPEAGALTKTIVARRSDAMQPRIPQGKRPHDAHAATAPPAEAQDFMLADEIGDLPGVDTALFIRLRPLFTTANRSAGIDPSVAAPAIRALIPTKELASAAYQDKTTPSNHTDFTITATLEMPSGQRFTRRALFRLDPEAGPLGRFMTWNAPAVPDPPSIGGADTYCRRFAAALAG